jgi:hypothetical protein
LLPLGASDSGEQRLNESDISLGDLAKSCSRFREAPNMNLKRWAIAIVSMTVGVGLAIEIFGLPVVRSSDYRAVVAAYSRAQPKQEVARGNH